MVFTGEAAWRWRMLMPATDRAYETFWRQAVRWVSIAAADPVTVTAPAAVAPGESWAVRIAVRNTAFEPLRDAEVRVRLAGPDGRLQEARAVADPDDGPGRYLARLSASEPGVYRVTADARRASAPLGAASTAVLVGGADAEMSDQRMDRELLTRIAERSGGRFVGADAIPSLGAMLRARAPAAAISIRRDLWHNATSLVILMTLLGAEWVLRRRAGLR